MTKFSAAKAATIVTILAKGEAAARGVIAKAGESAMGKLITLLPKDAKGKLVPVTPTTWQDDYAPAFKDALTKAYGDNYGPRITWLKVAVIGRSHGVDGPAGLSDYYLTAKDVLVARGITKASKQGAKPSKHGSKKVRAMAARQEARAATGKASAKPAATFKPGKVYTDADMRQAAMILTGSTQMAGKLVIVCTNHRDELSKWMRELLAN